MAKIAAKIAGITGADESAKKTREQFTFLQKMAQAKCAEFKAELKEMYIGNGSDKSEIVGNRAFNYYSSQHVDIKVGCSDAITDAINSFFKGKSGIKDGFHKIITGAIDTLIGNSAIGEYQEDMFFIYPENNAIVRLDVKAYKYTFTEKGLIADCENVFCYTMAKSVVDHTKLNKDELLYFVSQMCESANLDNEQASLAEVKKFLTELIDIWNMLEGELAKGGGANSFKLSNPNAPKPGITMDELNDVIPTKEELIGMKNK